MSLNVNRNKNISFTLDGTSVDCQVQSYTFDPGIDDGDVLYSYCSSGANRTVQEVDDNPTLDVTFYADFHTTGVSRFLWEHKGEDVDFELVHLNDKADQKFTVTGVLRARPGPLGGDVRDNDMTETTFQVISYTATGV